MRLPVPVPLGGLGRVTSRGTVRPGNHAPDRGVLRSGESSGAVSWSRPEILPAVARGFGKPGSRVRSLDISSHGARALGRAVVVPGAP